MKKTFNLPNKEKLKEKISHVFGILVSYWKKAYSYVKKSFQKLSRDITRKDKKALTKLGLAVVLVVILLVIFINKKPQMKEAAVVDKETQAVESLVKEFGRRQALVSLVLDKSDRDAAISGHFGFYATPELIKKWQKDPDNAPGRLTADPWPDRIEIDSAQKNDDGTYSVEGRLVELTFDESAKDGIAGEYSVKIKLKKINEKWKITEYSVDRSSAEEASGEDTKNTADTASETP